MNLLGSLLFVCSLIFSSISIAGPGKESNTDLREYKSKFLVENHSSKSKYELRETNNSYSLFLEKGKKPSKIKRLSASQGEKIDQDFVGKFVSLKYSMPEFKGKKCEVVMKFILRDESIKICKGEEEKLALGKNVLSELDKVF